MSGGGRREGERESLLVEFEVGEDPGVLEDDGGGKDDPELLRGREGVSTGWRMNQLEREKGVY